MNRKEVRKTDDEHYRRVFYINNIVVADLRHDVSQCLGKDDIQHGLPMIHSDRFGTFELSGINTHDSTADGFCHIRSGIDGHNNDTHCPDILEGDTEEIRHPVVNKHSLQDHGSTAKDLHVRANDNPDQLKQYAFDNILIGTAGNCLQYTA